MPSTTTLTSRHWLSLLVITLLSFQLSGCAPLVVGGAAATTAVVATDRRTAGEQLDDKTITAKIALDVNQILKGQAGRVNSSSYAGQVLLVGDVPSAEFSQRIEQTVKGIEQVKTVYNRIRIGPVTDLSVRSNDSWITTKVTTALVNAKDVPSRTISVTTERGVVYLQGLVTHAEGERAAKAAANISGVNQVVKLFDYISAEKTLLPTSKTMTDTAAPITPPPAAAPTTNQPEVFTVE